MEHYMAVSKEVKTWTVKDLNPLLEGLYDFIWNLEKHLSEEKYHYVYMDLLAVESTIGCMKECLNGHEKPNA
jgi:hypothetical protein